MSLLTRLLNTFRPSKVNAELDRELASHIAFRTDELVARGVPPAEARRRAALALGHTTYQRERAREPNLLPWLEGAVGDLRYAVRALGRSKSYACVAIASLTLGIGANTTIFSLINALMLRPLPVMRPDELAMVVTSDGTDILTNPLWEQLRDGDHGLDGVLATSTLDFNLAESGQVNNVRGAWVSGSYFSVLGLQPTVGRLFTPNDDVRGCPPRAVVSHEFWQAKLGGSPTVVGSSLRLNGHAFEIAGVGPRGFSGLSPGFKPAIFVPLCSGPLIMGSNDILEHRGWWFLSVVVRVAPGVGRSQASAKLSQVSAAFFENTVRRNQSAEHQKRYTARRLQLQSLGHLSSLRARYERPLWMLMGTAGLVLLIACTNVANLMLARSTARAREFAVRVAIGAGTSRIVRQLFVEGLLVAAVGALTGLALARLGAPAVVALLTTASEAREFDLGVDGRVLMFTAAVTVLTTLIFALIPAWRAIRVSPQAAMKAEGRGVIEGHNRFRVTKGLVTVQIALSMVLLSVAGLLLGSFVATTRIDPGFEPHGVLVANVDMGLKGDAAKGGVALQARVVNRIRAIPGVTTVSTAALTPISDLMWNESPVFEGQEAPQGQESLVYMNRVWEGYFATLRTPIVLGRDFAESDRRGSQRVAIVNETTARRFFPGKSPLGGRFRLTIGDSLSDPYEIVGVARDAKYQHLRQEILPQAYLAMRQDTMPDNSVSFVIRSNGDRPEGLTTAITQAFAEHAPGATMSYTTLDTQLSDSLVLERLLATLSVGFGALALTIALIGLYGTMSYVVARRRGEIGVRIALGANRGLVLMAIMREVVSMTLLGLMVGVAASLAAGQPVGKFLYSLRPNDPGVLGASAALLAVVCLFAGFIPARRAARLDPMTTLREQ